VSSVAGAVVVSVVLLGILGFGYGTIPAPGSVSDDDKWTLDG
jgi:hypothetical protein